MAIFYSCSLFFEFAILLYTKLEEVVYYYISTLLCHSSGSNVCLTFTFIFVTGSLFFGLLFCAWFVSSGSASKHISANTRMLKPLYLRFSWLMLMNILWEKSIFQIINFWIRQSDLVRTWASQWRSLTCSTVE